ncbi:hypothetical protein D1872_323990 [compost metagenome]
MGLRGHGVVDLRLIGCRKDEKSAFQIAFAITAPLPGQSAFRDPLLQRGSRLRANQHELRARIDQGSRFSFGD